MFALPAILFLLVVTGLSWRPGRDLEAALSRAQTQTVKGVFVAMVFFSHFCPYVSLDRWFDKPLAVCCSWFGQLMVVPFLFYSGYGVFEAAKEKGMSYVRSFPRKRILKTWVHFAMALVLFAVFDAFFAPSRLSVPALFSAMAAWTSIGNSTWFVFAILCAYLFAWAGFFLFRGDRPRALLFTAFLCVLYIAAVSRCKPSWWWDTILAFPLGGAVSLGKGRLAFLEGKWPWRAACTLALGALAVAERNWIPGGAVRAATALSAMMALIVLLSMRMALGSRILSWLGGHVFGIYILQRLPMDFGASFGWNGRCIYLYLAFCLVSTLLLAVLFDKAARFVDSKWLDK